MQVVAIWALAWVIMPDAKASRLIGWGLRRIALAFLTGAGGAEVMACRKREHTRWFGQPDKWSLLGQWWVGDWTRVGWRAGSRR